MRTHRGSSTATSSRRISCSVRIMPSADHALVADFGIARAISAAGGRTLTGVGEQVGSPAYMSPEQFTGSRTVDVRTDIYSLACVLYEMLVGEPPLLDVLTRPATGRRSLDDVLRQANAGHHTAGMRSEERRGGKEFRVEW